MSVRLTSFFSLVLVTALVHSAVAQEATYSFDGVIDIASPFLGDRFQVGDLVTGSFTFDSGQADGQPGDPTLGSYVASVS